uniref:Uncharacterized protein n=1 Tax=Pseudomonas marincola TaxID=437900 RepID=A0A653DZ29_9PSED
MAEYVLAHMLAHERSLFAGVRRKLNSAGITACHAVLPGSRC